MIYMGFHKPERTSCQFTSLNRAASVIFFVAFLIMPACELTGCAQSNREQNGAHASRVLETDSPNSEPVKSATSNADAPIKIIQKPFYVAKGSFIEKQNSSKGLTEWFFHCYPEFKYETIKNPLEPNTVTLTIEKVTLTISCPVTVRVGNLSKATAEHEDGHVQIVKQVYATADAAARTACQKAIGKQFKGTGSNTEAATEDALDRAGQEICKKYTDSTTRVVNEISSNYDEITQHGNAKVPVDEAIKLAKKKYNSSH